MSAEWDIQADVVVVGFGAAGACAALEAAAAGCSVLVLERFTGGGATALSGGIVYAGGGTPQQRAAGVSDSAEAMLGYLRTEVGDVVPARTLREFCDGSVAMLAWLESHGVPFEGSLCPDKTSYPTNRHYLYYSGSEVSARDAAPPAPRGHRTRGRGTSGGLLFARLAAAVRAAGVQIVPQTAVVRLITADGRVTGVECRSLHGVPWWAAAAHRVLHGVARKPYLYAPKLGRVMHRPVGWLERRHGRTLLVGADRGVVVAAGGFGANRPMLRAHAPSARGGLPLATPGDDGSGVRLGTGAGGAAALLDRVSVWRFLSPPSALLRGVLVDASGKRVCDESRYGAAIGDEIVRRGGRAWLLADRATVAAARSQLRGSTLWFQWLQAWNLLTFGRVSADTVPAVAVRAGVDPGGLAATVAAYNTVAYDKGADPAGKPADLLSPQDQPPYSLIDLSVRPRLMYPAPVLTLGGLVADPDTGQVLRPDGTAVPGLYAAGRSAVGLCSRSYVSGLSIADCVFSGRRAGRHAAAARESGGRKLPPVVRMNPDGAALHPQGPGLRRAGDSSTSPCASGVSPRRPSLCSRWQLRHRFDRGILMNITLPALRRHRDGSGRRPRRAARISAALAALAVPALLGATLAGPASASTGFTTHVTPNNTFFLLLDVSGGSTYAGAPVIDWYSNGGANQDWLFSSVNGGNTYDIINVNSNMCLTTDGVAGDQVYQEPCDGSLLQQWQTGLTPGNGLAYTIKNVSSGLYLDVSGDSPWAGAAIDTWYYNGGANQQFGGV